MALLSFLSIVGFVAVLSKKYPRIASVFPLVVSTAIIMILYLSTLTGLLFWTSKIILFAGLASLIYALFSLLIRNGFKPAGILSEIRSIPSEFWAFLVLSIAWYFYVQSAVLHNSDEFYWARYTKLIFYNLGLTGDLGTVVDYGIRYSPIAPLNHYFFLQLGKYSEPVIYFAQGVLAFSALSYLFVLRRVNFKRNLILLLILFSFLSYFLFSQFGFLSILVDHLIGIIFGITMLISIFSLRSIKEKILLMPMLALLATIKENGMIFAYIIVLLNLLDLWFFSRKSLKASILNILIVLAIVFIPFLAYKSWYVYLGRYKINSKFTTRNIIPPEDQLVDDEPVRDRAFIEKEFGKAVLTRPVNSAFQKDSDKIKSIAKDSVLSQWILRLTDIGRLSLAMWLAVSFFFVFLIAKCLSGKDRKTFLLLFIVLIPGFFLYLSLLMIAYAYFYPLREARELTSVVRYMNTYTLGYFTALIGATIFWSESIFQRKNITGTAFLIAGMVILFIFETPPINVFYTYPSVNIEMTNRLKESVAPWVEILNTKTEDKSTTFIFTKFQDVESPILEYEIFPRKLNTGKLKRVESEGEEDRWVTKASPDDIKSVFESGKAQYLLVDRVDASFWGEYKEFFENISDAKNYRLFKVERTEEGNFKCVPYIS